MKRQGHRGEIQPCASYRKTQSNKQRLVSVLSSPNSLECQKRQAQRCEHASQPPVFALQLLSFRLLAAAKNFLSDNCFFVSQLASGDPLKLVIGTLFKRLDHLWRSPFCPRCRHSTALLATWPQITPTHRAG